MFESPRNHFQLLDLFQQSISGILVDVFMRSVVGGQVILPRSRVTAIFDLALYPDVVVLPLNVSAEIPHGAVAGVAGRTVHDLELVTGLNVVAQR